MSRPCKHKCVNGDKCSRNTLDEHQLCSKHKRYKMYDHLKTNQVKKPIEKKHNLKKEWVSDKDINKPQNKVEKGGGEKHEKKVEKGGVKKVREIVIETVVDDDDGQSNNKSRKLLTQPTDDLNKLYDPVEEEFEKILEECIFPKEPRDRGEEDVKEKVTKKVSADKESAEEDEEDEESIQAKKLAALKLKNQIIASHLLKTGYFTLIKVGENFHESLSGLAVDLQKDKNVNEVLEELASEYMEELGISEMSPEMRLMLLTGVAIGNKFATFSSAQSSSSSSFSSSSSSSSCQVNVSSTLMDEIDRE